MQAISASVGRGGTNRPVDVAKVQVLLNAHGISTTVDGDSNMWLESSIESFQRDVVGLKKPDGKIGAAGATWNKLNAAKPAAVAASLSGTALATIDETTRLAGIVETRFTDLYQRQFLALSPARRDGLAKLIEFLNGDADVLDVRWGAYMLATVKHECAERWLPIEEFGKGKGKAYGSAETVTDSEGKKHTNTYYGRGYVQLTWKSNYQSIGQALGLGDALVINPAKALEAETAYAIMSYGMRNGTFTNKKLSDFIHGKTLDYRNARKIINGLDKADLIKGHAEKLQVLLLLSLNRSSNRLPADADCTRHGRW